MKPRFATLTALVLVATTPVLRAGSLWVKESNNEAGLVSDLRARRLGDILTIVVSETVTATTTTDVKTSRDSSPSLQAESIRRLSWRARDGSSSFRW